jgi:hypothetical protein
LARLATAAAALGVVDGAWVILTNYVWQSCSGVFCLREDMWNSASFALSIVLVLVSLAAFVGPRRVFYLSAVVSLALAGSIALWSPAIAPTVLALALAIVVFGVSVLAARRKGVVSEQANPMNLPVFG